jgi:hypothetical protein
MVHTARSASLRCALARKTKRCCMTREGKLHAPSQNAAAPADMGCTLE